MINHFFKLQPPANSSTGLSAFVHVCQTASPTLAFQPKAEHFLITQTPNCVSLAPLASCGLTFPASILDLLINNRTQIISVWRRLWDTPPNIDPNIAFKWLTFCRGLKGLCIRRSHDGDPHGVEWHNESRSVHPSVHGSNFNKTSSRLCLKITQIDPKAYSKQPQKLMLNVINQG